MGNSRNKRQSAFYQKIVSPLPWPANAVSVPRYQGHRGYWISGQQENTLAAFAEAKLRGYTMVELDVHLSSDKIPVVFHDFETSRFSKDKRNVNELSARLLHQLTGAPTLEQVLQSSNVPAKLNIELKNEKIIDEAAERKVWELIVKYNAHGRVLISSFNPFSLWRFSLYSKQIPLALLASNDLENPLLRDLWALPFLPFHLLHLEENMLDDESIQAWHSKGIPLAAWTVNDKSVAEKLLSLGCLSIITDALID